MNFVLSTGQEFATLRLHLTGQAVQRILLLTSTSNEYRTRPLHVDNNSELRSFLREEMGRVYGRLITRLFPSEEIFQTFDYLYFSEGTINLYLIFQNVSTK